MATIKANRRLVRTPFALEIGKVYRLSATGKWTDFIPTTTASGYSAFYLKCFEKWRRLPDAKWFSIIGQIDDQRETRFDIGILLEKNDPSLSTATGVLQCFANDLSFMYWNNWGAIELGVEEI